MLLEHAQGSHSTAGEAVEGTAAEFESHSVSRPEAFAYAVPVFFGRCGVFASWRRDTMDWQGYEFSTLDALWGETPSIFLVELIARTVTLLLFALILVRWLGKRGLGQVSPYEFVVLIAMGSALGDPMFYPTVPLLPPMVVLAVIVVMQRCLSWATEQHERIEKFVEGVPRICIRDGKVDLAALRDEHVPFDELVMLLREKGVENLASVRLAILETSGRLSVFSYQDDVARVGLSLSERAERDEDNLIHAGENVDGKRLLACTNCGDCRSCDETRPLPRCVHCSSETFVSARSTKLS
jgi:uncharacterized membrane protein YcaP (DUF421 family)